MRFVSYRRTLSIAECGAEGASLFRPLSIREAARKLGYEATDRALSDPPHSALCLII